MHLKEHVKEGFLKGNQCTCTNTRNSHLWEDVWFRCEEDDVAAEDDVGIVVRRLHPKLPPQRQVCVRGSAHHHLAGGDETGLHEPLAERKCHLTTTQEPDSALQRNHVRAPGRRRRHRSFHFVNGMLSVS